MSLRTTCIKKQKVIWIHPGLQDIENQVDKKRDLMAGEISVYKSTKKKDYRLKLKKP
jgi:hypothetical protein